MHVDGACHCGAVQFSADVDEGRVTVCHCTDCQVLSGAPFRAVVPAPYESLKVTGPTKRYVKVAQSGNRRAQVFCPECATPLWTAAPENPTSVMIRIGCLRQRTAFEPAVQLWRRSELPWVHRLAQVPGSAEQQASLTSPALKS
jgi:hypothetical protein